MKKMRPTLVAAMVAVGFLTPLAAQDGQDGQVWQFGAGLYYAVSTGGLGAFAFGQKPLADHFALQVGADYGFGARTGECDKYVHDVSQWGVDAKLIWSLNGLDAPGPFAFASLGFQNTAWYEAADGLYGESGPVPKNSATTPRYGVGCGYNVTKRFGVLLLHRFGPDPWARRLEEIKTTGAAPQAF
jgi:hypothetical protein